MLSAGPETSRLTNSPSPNESSESGDGRAVAIEQGAAAVQVDQLAVAQARVGGHQADLVERQAGLDADREGARDDLQVERAVVSGAISSKRWLRSVSTRVKTSRRPVELFGLALARISDGSRSSSISGTR